MKVLVYPFMTKSVYGTDISYSSPSTICVSIMSGYGSSLSSSPSGSSINYSKVEPSGSKKYPLIQDIQIPVSWSQAPQGSSQSTHYYIPLS